MKGFLPGLHMEDIRFDVVAGLNPEVLKVVERSPLGELLGSARIFANLREAVHTYETRRATS